MLKKEQYLKTVKRPYPPLFCTLVCMGYRDKNVFKGILKEPFCYLHMAHVDSVWYYSKKEVETGGNMALASWQDAKLLNSVKNDFQQREKNFTDSALKDFEKFARAYQDYMVTLNLVFALEKPAENALRTALSKKLTIEETDRLMSELNIPFLDNFYKQEEYDLVNSTDLADHIKKYIWLNARYGEEKEYTIEEAKEKLKNINKNKFLHEWNEGKIKLKKIIEDTKKLLGKDSILVDIFQYIIFYRTHRTDTINKAQFLALPMLKEKARSLDLTYQEFLRCSGEELLTNKIPSKDILQERIKDCSTLMDNGVISCLIGEESKKLIDFFREDVKSVTEFKGNIACKGKVQGIVKVISNSKDFLKVEDGNILVTSMTTPEMVPIMKKAVAFVTDEGGVTCHAAIVSREMNKPCIIGTKVATQVLKDGDVVEVDANNGVIKILK